MEYAVNYIPSHHLEQNNFYCLMKYLNVSLRHQTGYSGGCEISANLILRPT